MLTGAEFAAKWRVNRSKERSAAQEHFIDLCQMLGVPTPNEADPSGENYAFEKGASKLLGGQEWADVWKRGCFAIEYKGKHADLNKAYQQLQQYRESLQSPPLLITCDLERIVIHTNFTSTVKQVFEVTLEDIEADQWTRISGRTLPPKLSPHGLLRLIFTEYKPEAHPLRSDQTIESVTILAAKLFGDIAAEMQKDHENPQQTAHFLIRVLFCLFAEDVGLLPRYLFREMLEASGMKSKAVALRMKHLFQAMRDGGIYGNYDIKHFNGGLFDGDVVLEIDGASMTKLRDVSDLDWSAIEPSIFGTLFERGLDPAKRSQLGAHYTSRDDINLIVEPVLMAPLRREWDDTQARANAILASQAVTRLDEFLDKKRKPSKAQHQTITQVNDLLLAFQTRLAGLQVLDPACGSGNFLYVALRATLDLEKQVIGFANTIGLPPMKPQVSPAQLFGLELNTYAHELAQATVWIGYIQWLHDNGFGFPPEPILRQLDTIRNMDAILAADGSEPTWPQAEVIIGNPPFLGGSKLRRELGNGYAEAVFKLYGERIPASSDLVCYWFEKARAQIQTGITKRAGLISTQSIRAPASRAVLERIKETGGIFMAWQDKAWVLEGASVRVSITGFDNGTEPSRFLDGQSVAQINADLSTLSDLTKAQELAENKNLCFQGPSPKAPFDIDDKTAQRMLKAGENINGRPNSDVVRPVVNSSDLVQENRKIWTIDFGLMSLEQAVEYELPFEYVKEHVYPVRKDNPIKWRAENWWLYGSPSTNMRIALKQLERFIATPRVGKFRVFVWLQTKILANDRTFVFARDDDYFFGVLHSRIHEVWSLATSSRHGVGNDPTYNTTTCFETFPFPWPPGTEPSEAQDACVKAIAEAARELVQKRDRWLASETRTLRDDSPEYYAGLNAAPKKPKKTEARTLTNLYNQRPTWLDLAHKKLDAAVFAAYGWPINLSDDDILARLLALNLARAGQA
jgi:hypothetical protein